MNGDIEDNLDDFQPGHRRIQIGDDETVLSSLKDLEPFRPDPDHLDPHMEKLCRQVRKMSIASFSGADASSLGQETTSQKEYILTGQEDDSGN